VVDIWFYQLSVTGLDSALPELLEKVVENGWRAYVHGHDQDIILQLDTHLWTYRPNSFMAHGVEGDEFPAHQPILLGTSGEMINGPDVYISIAPLDWPQMDTLKRALIIFDGKDEEHLGWARTAWKRLKAADYPLAYWQQDERRKWSKTM
jgi:DNA polymerase-3 subunit chi